MIERRIDRSYRDPAEGGHKDAKRFPTDAAYEAHLNAVAAAAELPCFDDRRLIGFYNSVEADRKMPVTTPEDY